MMGSKSGSGPRFEHDARQDWAELVLEGDFWKEGQRVLKLER